MKKINLLIPILTSLSLLSFNSFAHDLKGAINSDDRTPKNISRDKYRNPYEPITFFGIESKGTNSLFSIAYSAISFPSLE